LYEMPLEDVNLVFSKISLWIFRATDFAVRSLDTRCVISRYASSRLSGSTTSEYERNISIISFDTDLYTSKRGLTYIPSGHSLCAVLVGIAECTPNLRAS